MVKSTKAKRVADAARRKTKKAPTLAVDVAAAASPESSARPPLHDLDLNTLTPLQLLNYVQQLQRQTSPDPATATSDTTADPARPVSPVTTLTTASGISADTSGTSAEISPAST